MGKRKINVYKVRSYLTGTGQIRHEYKGLRENNKEVPVFNGDGRDPVAQRITEAHKRLIEETGITSLETTVKGETSIEGDRE